MVSGAGPLTSELHTAEASRIRRTKRLASASGLRVHLLSNLVHFISQISKKSLLRYTALGLTRSVR